MPQMDSIAPHDALAASVGGGRAAVTQKLVFFLTDDYPPMRIVPTTRERYVAPPVRLISVMRRSPLLKITLPVLLTLAVGVGLSGCGFVHDEHLVGPYYLTAVDTSEQMSLGCAVEGGSRVGRIDETVFAVGWNDRYIVAKQHPKNDRRVTNYFFLDVSRDSAYADPRASVTGPLTEAEFQAKKAELGLPGFKRSVRSLE